MTSEVTYVSRKFLRTSFAVVQDPFPPFCLCVCGGGGGVCVCGFWSESRFTIRKTRVNPIFLPLGKNVIYIGKETNSGLCNTRLDVRSDCDDAESLDYAWRRGPLLSFWDDPPTFISPHKFSLPFSLTSPPLILSPQGSGKGVLRLTAYIRDAYDVGTFRDASRLYDDK